jgi:hypothetical protein
LKKYMEDKRKAEDAPFWGIRYWELVFATLSNLNFEIP